MLVLPASQKEKRTMNDKELRERIAAVLEDADAIDKIMAIIQPLQDKIADLRQLLEIERRANRGNNCPF